MHSFVDLSAAMFFLFVVLVVVNVPTHLNLDARGVVDACEALVLSRSGEPRETWEQGEEGNVQPRGLRCRGSARGECVRWQG